MTKWKPFKLNNLTKDTQRVFDILNEESDISCALMGTSYLSELLASILLGNFIKSSISTKILDPRNGSIGGFISRTDLAYCLGLIDKSVYQDLVKIANIRNKFAHSHLELSFSDDSICKACNELQSWRIIENFSNDGSYNESENQSKVSPRDIFNLSVVLICQRLQVGTLSNKKQETTA